MLVIKIKGHPTIGNLQGPWEASLVNKSTWRNYAEFVDKMVKRFGHTTMPDHITRAQVEEWRTELAKTWKNPGQVLSACSSYYVWMQHMGFATTNPFRRLRGGHGATNRDVQVIFA